MAAFPGEPGNKVRAFEAIIAAFALLVAVALIGVLQGPPGRRVIAYFGTAIGVYPGSDVRVLGVKVGSISSIEPRGSQVRVAMSLDRDVPVPEGARAVVVAPNLVSDRYVQLTPAYSGGPRLAAGAQIPVTRTATPMELDQLYSSLRRFATDLGPRGVNSKGALSEVLRVGAANLGGNGRALNTMIAEFGKASRTLADSSGDLFATMANLSRFTAMLRANDGQVRLFERQFAQVSEFLAADRDELAAALRTLAVALGQVKDFIGDNRARLKSNVRKLASITQLLVDQRASLAEALDIAPLAAGNALNAYDPVTQRLMSRGNLLEITAGFGKGSAGPAEGADTRPVCAAAGAASRALRAQCDRLTAGGLTAVPPSQVGTLPPLPLPPAGPVYGGPDRPAFGGGGR